MVLFKNWQFFHFFLFYAKYTKKMCLKIFYRDKMPFKTIKTRSHKTGVFPKGLVHGFGPKFRIFPFSYFNQYTLLWYSRKKKKPFSTIKTRSSKSPKIDIFPKGLTHGFGPKMGMFLTIFLGNIGQENVFTIF